MVSFISPDPGQLTAAELPPSPIGDLAVGTVDLLLQAADLPQPGYIALSSSQHIALQFTPDRSGAAAVTRWAMRFGGVLVSEQCEDRGTAYTLCEVRFDYYGVRIAAYALIPAGTAT